MDEHYDGYHEEVMDRLDVYLDKIVAKRESLRLFLRWRVQRERAHWPSTAEMPDPQ